MKINMRFKQKVPKQFPKYHTTLVNYMMLHVYYTLYVQRWVIHWNQQDVCRGGQWNKSSHTLYKVGMLAQHPHDQSVPAYITAEGTLARQIIIATTYMYYRDGLGTCMCVLYFWVLTNSEVLSVLWIAGTIPTNPFLCIIISSGIRA